MMITLINRGNEGFFCLGNVLLQQGFRKNISLIQESEIDKK